MSFTNDDETNTATFADALERGQQNYGQQQREFKRYEVDLTLTFLGPGGTSFDTHTKTFSLGGMSFSPGVPLNFLQEGGLVFLFSPKHNRKLSINVEMVQRDNSGASSVKFAKLSDRVRDTLNDWLRDFEEADRKSKLKKV